MIQVEMVSKSQVAPIVSFINVANKLFEMLHEENTFLRRKRLGFENPLNACKKVRAHRFCCLGPPYLCCA